MKLLLLISSLTETMLLVFTALILLLVKSRDGSGMRYYRRAKRWMSLCIFMAGVSFLSEQIASGFGEKVEILDIYNQMFFFILSVSGQLALVHLYNSEQLGSRALMWIFMPVVVLTGVYAVLVTTSGPGPVVYTFDELLAELPGSPVLMLRVVILFAIVAGIAASVYRYFLARRAYRMMLDNYFSDDAEWKRTKWIDHCLYCAFILVISTVISYLVASGIYDLFFQLIVTTCMLILVVRFINYQGQFTGVAPAVELAQTLPDSSFGMQKVKDPVTHSRVSEWTLRPDKPYLRSGLTLGDVAQVMGLSRQRLSSYLNLVLGMNFNGWIASLRIREVERRLRDPGYTMSLSETAYETGFADLAAMSNAFKKIMGASPSAYKKRVADEIHK